MPRRPLIGITAGTNDQEVYITLSRHFMEPLMVHGAMPVVLPLTDDPALLEDYVRTLDGVLFSGGVDVDPLLFGEQQHPACGAISPMRDAHELTLARILLRTGKPVLGICRGLQLMNIALGGDIYQDLPAQYPGELNAHRQKQLAVYPSHPVQLKEGSILHRIAGTDTLSVNSLHHQAVKNAVGWEAVAYAPDGVIEACEKPDHPFFVGVQWHPERLWEKDENARLLFAAFVKCCADGIAD